MKTLLAIIWINAAIVAVAAAHRNDSSKTNSKSGSDDWNAGWSSNSSNTTTMVDLFPNLFLKPRSDSIKSFQNGANKSHSHPSHLGNSPRGNNSESDQES